MKKILIWAMTLIALPALASAQNASPKYVENITLGIMNHDPDNLWSRTKKENGAAVNLEVNFASFYEIFGGKIHPAAGLTYAPGETSIGYADLRYSYPITSDWTATIGLGAAAHNGSKKGTPDQKALGTNILFHVPLEISYRLTETTSISGYFEHVSNGDFADENEGMDNIGLRVKYHF